MRYMRTFKFFTDSIKCFLILCSFIIYKCDYYIQPTKKNQDIAQFSNYANVFDYSEMYRTPVAMSKTVIKSNAQRKRSIYLSKIMFLLVRNLIFPRIRLTIAFRYVFYKYKNNLEICRKM